MTEYNGHRDYKYWNVALWINNDEKLYREAVEARKRLKTKRRTLDEAAKFLFKRIQVIHRTKEPQTPDGVAYTIANVKEAIRYIS